MIQMYLKCQGGLSIPIFATIIIIWLLIHLTKQEVTGIGIFIAILAIIYFLSWFIKEGSNCGSN
jgi:hypothetical protein